MTDLLTARNQVKDAKKERDELDPLKREQWSEVEIGSPPVGAVSEIADYINEKAARRIGDAAPIVDALQLVSILVGKNSLLKTGKKSTKLNLISLTIGLSAAGKENGQEVVKEALSHLGLVKYVSSNITSQKATAQSLIRNRGRACYVVDEAQSYFGAVSQKNAAAYLTQSVDQMLSLYTSKVHPLRDQEQTAIIQTIESLESKIEAEKKKAEKNLDPDDPVLVSEKLIRLENELEYCKEILVKGIINPQFNAMFYSTPVMMDGVINRVSIEKGLIGRCLVVRAPEERGELEFDPFADDEEDVSFDSIKTTVERLNTLNGVEFVLSDEAKEIGRDVLQFFESRINNYTLGAIYARAFELTMKIAALVSIRFERVGEKGFTNAFHKVEPEHVIWAFKLVRHSLGNIRELVTVNENDSPDDQYFISRVNQISAGKWIPRSSMIQSLTRSKKDASRWTSIAIRKSHTEKGAGSIKSNKQLAEDFLDSVAELGLIKSRPGKRGGMEYCSIN
ncbi:TPA: DUF3987 domain-containing protein [Vibrio parahaemolyticus]|nr:DUF3987 domain-containing protein [Vibrio parahaemolyticus]HCE2322285.1 DUF3987 domain-containing protein [Vibrio parahaemolyticus]HCE2338224.1 DUF3987 domain-containing protein [Vibrio parahaemolyticus]HCE2353955.1 DUF3987 domain-containing protein [Vibrio parahaemolyticus]HCE2359067.1 DUF3987 domain-containing protein [Vibrio parahaemolyticus]